MSTEPLPGLGGQPYRKIDGAEFQDLAQKVHATVYNLLNYVHHDYNAARGATHGDGGPIIQGALGGILQFACLGDITDERLTAELLNGIRTILPQIRMEMAAMGREGGRA